MASRGLERADADRLVLDAGVVGALPIRMVLDADVGRNLLGAGPQAAHDRTDRRATGFARNRGPRRLLPGVAAVEHVARVQVRHLRAAEDRELVGDLRLHRHQLADFHARHVGANGIELAAVLDRRLRLHVVHVEVRRAAAQVNHDRRLGPPAVGRRGGLQPQQIGQSQPAQGQRSHAQKAAAADAVASAKGPGMHDREHVFALVGKR